MRLVETARQNLSLFDSFTWGLWEPQRKAQFLRFKHMDTSTGTGRKGEGEATWVSLHGGNARHLRKAPARGKEPEVWTRPGSRPQNPREVMVLAEAAGRYLNASISAQGYILMKGWGDGEKPCILWWSWLWCEYQREWDLLPAHLLVKLGNLLVITEHQIS